MPNFKDIVDELDSFNHESPFDKLRNKYLNILSRNTNSNVIIYYSNFLQDPGAHNEINDLDKNALMQ